MRVGILYQMPRKTRGLAALRVQAVHAQVLAVKRAVVEAGHRALAVKMTPSSFTKLREMKLNAIINLCQDHVRQKGYLEPHVSAMLDLLDVPYTGSNYLTIATSLDKIRSKELLVYHGLPTPHFAVLTLPERPFVPPFQGKLFLKPAYQDGSIGIDRDSVVETEKQYKLKLANLIRQFKEPIIVEQYLPGREFIIEIVGNRKPEVLPIAERLFLAGVPFVTSEGRWNPQSAQYGAVSLQCPADLTPTLRKRLERLALRAYQVLGCRDYAKVDIRCNARGKPFILEVNPHQDMGDSSELALIWQQSGKTYAQLVDKLLSLAMERKKRVS